MRCRGVGRRVWGAGSRVQGVGCRVHSLSGNANVGMVAGERCDRFHVISSYTSILGDI